MKQFILSAVAALFASAAISAPIVTTDILTRGSMEWVPAVTGGVEQGGFLAPIFGGVWLFGTRFDGISIGAMNGKFGPAPIDPDPDFRDSLLMFCIDLFHGAAPVGTGVKYDKIDFANGLNPYDGIAKLITFNGGLASKSASDSAAMQLAVWNIVYDTDLDVANGKFRTNYMGGTDVVSKANALLVGASGVSQNLYNISLLTDNAYAENTKAGYQDFITASLNSGGDFGNDVPEPDALALAGIGLLGLGIVTRRRKVN